MKVELLVSDWCPTCPAAERVWRAVAAEREIELAVLDLAQPEGRQAARRHGVRTIPAVIVEGRLAAVGVPSLEQARALVARAPARRKASPVHAGMILSGECRAFVIAAMAYLVAAAAWIAWHGALVTGGPERAAGIHLFTGGFVLSLIYGLGAHMLPRFTGNPVRAGPWSWAQFALLHGGLPLFAAGSLYGSRAFALAGAVAMWSSLALYALRLWPVLWPRGAGRRERDERRGQAGW